IYRFVQRGRPASYSASDQKQCSDIFPRLSTSTKLKCQHANRTDANRGGAERRFFAKRQSAWQAPAAGRSANGIAVFGKHPPGGENQSRVAGASEFVSASERQRQCRLQ